MSAAQEEVSEGGGATEFVGARYFINRELSWLEFNQRVLDEAADPTQPLLERLRFLGINASNLDEFFEIRVAGIKQQIENDSGELGPERMTPQEVFPAIRRRVLRMVRDQYRLWKSELLPALGREGIHFLDLGSLGKAEQAWAARYFRDEVFPVLTPLAIDPSHPFPQLLNKSDNLIVLLGKPGVSGRPFHAIVQIPRVLNRLVEIGGEGGGRSRGAAVRFLFLRDLLGRFLGELFPGLDVRGAHGFRITRNSDLYIDDEEAENLLSTIEGELRKRSRGNAVRLEIEAGTPPRVERMLLQTFGLREEDCYRVDSPLSFFHFNSLVQGDRFPRLRDRPWIPVVPAALPAGEDPFPILRGRDVLLHHPYDSFEPVVDFLEGAAADPTVLAIKLTLYRTSGDSPILRALIAAANAGKQVTVLMELKARFDEENNINWARRLEEAGVHVVYGLVGLKTHCKLLLVVRRDADRIRLYCHLGTGNYHPRTAKLYSDLGLLTTNQEITGEVAALFNQLTSLSEFHGYKRLLVAPFGMAERFHELIEREAANARAGYPARIVVKVNALSEEEMIRALYRASMAGVKIDLIVRGICCLRPGLADASANIRVVSIVGRFLEHHRIFYFQNRDDPLIFAGSADWMPRNLFRRVEVVFPIDDPALKRRVAEEILPMFLSDNGKARELQPDGSYRRVPHPDGTKVRQAQFAFRERARKQSAASPDEA